MLYEEKLNTILSRNWKKGNEQEKKRTTVHLPQWLRLSLSELKELYNLSWAELTSRMIEHGFSIIQHRYNEQITAIGKYRKKFRFAKIETIRNFFTDFSVSVDGLEKPKNRPVAVNKNIYSGIGEIGEKLGIDLSSMIRLCLYHSLIETDDIPAEMKNHAQSEVDKFERTIVEREHVMGKLVEADDGWEEKWEKWQQKKKANQSMIDGGN